MFRKPTIGGISRFFFTNPLEIVENKFNNFSFISEIVGYEKNHQSPE